MRCTTTRTMPRRSSLCRSEPSISFGPTSPVSRGGTMTEFAPRRDVQAISHVNVVVDDIEVATEFYSTVLGFEQAANADGPMDYPGVDLASFARDAGFDDGRVSLDVRFLKHPE